MTRKPARTPRKQYVKRAVDRRVAEILDYDADDVATITEAFLGEVIALLANGAEVRLDGLGTIHVVAVETKTKLLTLMDRHSRKKHVVEIPRKYYVKVRKAARLRESLRAQHGRPKARRTDDGQVRRRRDRQQ